MKLTNDLADYLLTLPKKILDKGTLASEIVIHQTFPLTARYELISEEDDEFTFLWVIQQSKKNRIRVSFHHQENDGKTGLIRIDYNSGHKNPEIITDLVPEKFHPYVGKHFDNHEHHIHYHVQGYQNLHWAIPLSADSFPIKELNADPSFNSTFAEVIQSFASLVNIETEIKFNPILL